MQPGGVAGGAVSADRPGTAYGVDHEALESFIGKWRARWPEWSVAEVFVPPAQHPIALAWAALQQELTDAAWGGSDARPGEAKLAWWAEELIGWSRGMRRHPLGVVLQTRATSWPALAAALPALPASRERPRDPEESGSMLQPLTEAMAAIDAELFGSEGRAGVDHRAAQLVAACLQQARFQQPGDAHVPLSLLAGQADGGGRDRWARHLLAHWPTAGGARPRRLWAALARERLEHGDATRPVPTWRVLWLSWRAARN